MTDERLESRTKVLVVEDERELAETYAAHLDEYVVEVAYGGEEAFELLDGTVDVVFLDRRMPVVSGNEVLAYIEEEGLDCRVAMVTAANPDFDIIDFRIDDYLVKPVSGRDVRESVERLLALDAYDDRMRELSSKKLKRNVLKLEKSKAELANSDEFDRLNGEIAALEAEVESITDELELDRIEKRR